MTPEQSDAAVNIVRSVCAIARTTGALPCDAENWVRGFLVKREQEFMERFALEMSKKDARIAELEAALEATEKK